MSENLIKTGWKLGLRSPPNHAVLNESVFLYLHDYKGRYLGIIIALGPGRIKTEV
jgi:hypothetical protein